MEHCAVMLPAYALQLHRWRRISCSRAWALSLSPVFAIQLHTWPKCTVSVAMERPEWQGNAWGNTACLGPAPEPRVCDAAAMHNFCGHGEARVAEECLGGCSVLPLSPVFAMRLHTQQRHTANLCWSVGLRVGESQGNVCGHGEAIVGGEPGTSRSIIAPFAWVSWLQMHQAARLQARDLQHEEHWILTLCRQSGVSFKSNTIFAVYTTT